MSSKDVIGALPTEAIPKTEIDMCIFSQSAMFVCNRNIF